MSAAREEALFALALEKPAEKRPAFLDVMCEGDAALRQRLDALLAAHEAPEDSLATDAAARAKATIKLDLPEEPADEAVGQTLGRYKLLERVGEGGCGVVYVAEQTEPVRRRVALKVIKLGMDTKQVVARFEAERQALAMMDHPNIAKVLDAGSTEGGGSADFSPQERSSANTRSELPDRLPAPTPLRDKSRAPFAAGRPFFVMELVRGIRITDYCDQANLTTKDRLDLFIKVCQAIQHAHQKGIIHRDIKPSNILVTLHDGVPVPKVIDFGIAKATEGRLTDNTVYTQLHQFIGTPAYMSPEQAEMSGLDIDTRSDIYSLGVLLYELLAGSTPFDAKELMASGIDAMRKTIREKEPVRPSTRLATLGADQLTTTAKRRSADTSKLLHQLKGDLDWIVMKCLEKDRSRRYDTANGLSADLKRHLDNEPVLARPPSTAYKFQKAFRRNKLAFTAATVVMMALLVGIVGTTLGLVRAEKQRRAAELARKDAEEIATFLGDIFQNPDPTQERRTVTVPDLLNGDTDRIQVERVVTAADMLNVAAKKLETELAAQPGQRAKLQATLGRTYFGLGLYPQAIALQEKVRDYYVATHGSEHPDTLAALYDLAWSYHGAGRRPEAVRLLEQTLPILRRQLGPEHPQVARTMSALGFCYERDGRRDEAIKTSEEAIALCRKVFGLEHRETLLAMNALAISYHSLGLRKEALALREEVLLLRRKVLGPEHPETINAMENLANSYQADERVEEALKLREDVLALRRRTVGPEHPDTIHSMGSLAGSYEAVGRIDEAVKLAEETLALSRKVLGSEHPNSLMAMNFMANIYLDAGRLEEEIRMREELVQLSRKIYGMKEPYTDLATRRLVSAHLRTGRRGDAVRIVDELLALYRKTNGPDRLDPEPIADICILVGRTEDAIALLNQAVRQAPGEISPAAKLAAVQAWLGRDADYAATVRTLVKHSAEFTDRRDANMAAQVVCLQPISDAPTREAALAFARKALEVNGGKRPIVGGLRQFARGMTEYRSGNYVEADTALNAGAQVISELMRARPRRTFSFPSAIQFYRAMSLYQQGKTAEAREVFAAAEAQMERRLAEEATISSNEGEPVESLISLIAQREAKALLGLPSTTKP